MDRDRNLLFGVFAVQLRKVSPSHLMEAASSWAVEPKKSLSQRLVDSGALSSADRKVLEGLVAEAIQGHDGSATAAMETFGGEVQVYQSFGRSIVLTESGGVTVNHVAQADDRQLGAEQILGVPETPGRYSHICECGRGGIGRVLLVQDDHLGREVALKELLPAHAGNHITPESDGHSKAILARFLQEARITGQLEHPSVVPVYELGHRRDGTLYYTMKLVRGRTLATAIAEAKSLGERLKLLPAKAQII